MNFSNVVPLKMWDFFLQILLASIILMANAKKKKFYWLRLLLVAGLSFPLYWLPSVMVWKFNINYLICLVILFPTGFFLYDENVFTYLFGSMASFGLQHLAWNILFLILDPIVALGESLDLWAVLGIKFLVYLLIYGIALLAVYKLKLSIAYSQKQLGSFIAGSTIFIIAFFLAQMVDILDRWTVIYRLYTALCALLGLVIMLGYPYLSELVVKENQLEEEKRSLASMLSMQAHQQELSKETIDIVNMKFHDMKNQLNTLRELNDTQRQASINEIEKSIDIYADITRTGNEALDIVLTQKSLLCTSKKIRFTYIIDGKSFDFMDKTDITSLFGNILDNAIEATEKETADDRLIKLQASLRNDFLSITEENYSHTPLTFKDGLPITTKDDKSLHGYGFKSLRYLVDKYHGNMSVAQEDNVFRLSLFIPIPKAK
jgi:signal transduction histidine kinase